MQPTDSPLPWYRRPIGKQVLLVLAVLYLFGSLNRKLDALAAGQKRMSDEIHLLKLTDRVLELTDKAEAASSATLAEVKRMASERDDSEIDFRPPPVPPGEVSQADLLVLENESPNSLYSKVESLCRGSNKHKYSLATLQAALDRRGYAVVFLGPKAQPSLVPSSTNALARPR